MSSLKIQILFLPVFLFQLLSPTIISSECPEKPTGLCIKPGLKKSIVNFKDNQSVSVSGIKVAKCDFTSHGSVLKRDSTIVCGPGRNFQAKLLCFICFYRDAWLNLAICDERVHFKITFHSE